MNNIQNVWKIHIRDKWSWIYIPTIILSSSFLVNIIVSYLVNIGSVYTGGISSIFIYILIIGILVVAQTFPFALGMSVRRIDFFLGTATMGIASSMVIGLFFFICSIVENRTAGWGTGLHFFHFPYLNEGTALEQILIYIILLAFLFFTGFTIASFARRFGGKGMIILALISLLVVSIALIIIHNFGLWTHIFQWFAGKEAVDIAYWLLPFIIFYIVCSYGLLKKATA